MNSNLIAIADSDVAKDDRYDGVWQKHASIYSS